MQWDLKETKTVLKTRPFTVEELHLVDRYKKEAVVYYRLAAPDWVNVLAITTDGKAILIRQSRPGAMADILETPGGCVDAGEKDAAATALRELEEETGYTSKQLIPLTVVNPNPAIQTNRMHLFLALDCRLVKDRKHFPDDGEKIEVVLTAIKDLEEMVRAGKINHGISCLTIMLAAKHFEGLPDYELWARFDISRSIPEKIS